MTREDTRRILEKVFRLYITQAKRISAEERAAMIDSWEETFASDSFDDVSRAVNEYARSGKPWMPNASDIINVLAADDGIPKQHFSEADRLFNRMAALAEVLANRRAHQTIIDPGGFRWDPELKRNVYHHPEVLISETTYTQYDFMQLPLEIQEYVEDIDGLRHMWPEIQSSREMARQRFKQELPEIKAKLEELEKRNIEEHMKRIKGGAV